MISTMMLHRAAIDSMGAWMMIRPASSMTPINTTMTRDEHIKLRRIVGNMQVANIARAQQQASMVSIHLPLAVKMKGLRADARNGAWKKRTEIVLEVSVEFVNSKPVLCKKTMERALPFLLLLLSN